MSNFDLRKYLAENKLVTEDKIDMINQYAKRIATGEEIQDEFFMDNKEEILQAADEIEKYMNSDIDMEESNIEEGWKEWALGGLMSLATLAGIGQAYLPNLDSLSSQEEIELAQNAYADVLRKMSDEDVDSIYTQVITSDIKDDLKQNKFSFTSRTDKATADAVWPAMQRAMLETAITRNMDRFVISKDGNVVFISNPGGITAVKENKPSMKMKKSELKEMIKAAFLSEADFTNAQDDDAALGGMYDPVYEADEKEETAEEILARITGTKVDPYLAEAKDEEEEMDITVDAEEETTDDGEGKLANDSIVVDKKIVSLSSLPQQTRKILDSLETLRAQAEEFGDQKFITQVGNTITFFTRDFVVAGDEPTKAKVNESLKNKKIINESLKNKKIMKESLEILRMKKLAGLLKEGEYAKALLRENNSLEYDELTDKIRKMSPQEFTDFVTKVGDYDLWSDAPNDIDPFNNIGDRMEVLSTLELKDINRYFNNL